MVKQIIWAERNFTFHSDPGYFPIIFSRLEGSLFRLQAILATADDEYCSHNAQGWSVKQHLGHLSDMEELWWKRLQDFLNGSNMLSSADMTNTKTEEADHNETGLESLMRMFVLERQKLLESVFDFDRITLSLSSMHPRLGISMKLIDHLFFIAEHDDHHISIISNLLRKQSAGI